MCKWATRLCLVGVVWVTSAAVGMPAWAAGSVRCDTDLVARGATFYEVLERCGEPEHEFARVDFRYPGYTVQLDEWTYDRGTNRFRRVLHFENGRLRRIELRSKPLTSSNSGS